MEGRKKAREGKGSIGSRWQELAKREKHLIDKCTCVLKAQRMSDSGRPLMVAHARSAAS